MNLANTAHFTNEAHRNRRIINELITFPFSANLKIILIEAHNVKSCLNKITDSSQLSPPPLPLLFIIDYVREIYAD